MDQQLPSKPDEADDTLAAVVTHGLTVFEDKAHFEQWLHSEIWALGGITPHSLLASAAGRKQVRGILTRIEWGIYS